MIYVIYMYDTDIYASPLNAWYIFTHIWRLYMHHICIIPTYMLSHLSCHICSIYDQSVHICIIYKNSTPCIYELTNIYVSYMLHIWLFFTGSWLNYWFVGLFWVTILLARKDEWFGTGTVFWEIAHLWSDRPDSTGGLAPVFLRGLKCISKDMLGQSGEIRWRAWPVCKGQYKPMSSYRKLSQCSM